MKTTCTLKVKLSTKHYLQLDGLEFDFWGVRKVYLQLAIKWTKQHLSNMLFIRSTPQRTWETSTMAQLTPRYFFYISKSAGNRFSTNDVTSQNNCAISTKIGNRLIRASGALPPRLALLGAKCGSNAHGLHSYRVRRDVPAPKHQCTRAKLKAGRTFKEKKKCLR